MPKWAKSKPTRCWRKILIIKTLALEQAIVGYKSAIEIYKQAELRPLTARALNSLGATFERAGKPKEAEAAYKEAIQTVESIKTSFGDAAQSEGLDHFADDFYQLSADAETGFNEEKARADLRVDDKSAYYKKNLAPLKNALVSLHGKLIAPIDDLIKDAKTLKIIPNADLFLLPFSALVAPDNSYLLEKHDLVFMTAGDLISQPQKTTQALSSRSATRPKPGLTGDSVTDRIYETHAPETAGGTTMGKLVTAMRAYGLQCYRANGAALGADVMKSFLKQSVAASYPCVVLLDMRPPTQRLSDGYFGYYTVVFAYDEDETNGHVYFSNWDYTEWLNVWDTFKQAWALKDYPSSAYPLVVGWK